MEAHAAVSSSFSFLTRFNAVDESLTAWPHVQVDHDP